MRGRVGDYVAGAIALAIAERFVMWVWWHCPPFETVTIVIPAIGFAGYEAIRRLK